MVYALNVFNLVDGGEETYKLYAVKAGRLLQRVGGSVAVAGRRPIRMLEGDLVRSYFMVVQFPDERAFATFLALVGTEDRQQTRQGITRDYIWTLYESWDLTRWVSE
ncbi:MAG TPA: DUF1330 domain-containing protein [Candidatus Acidoferrum sp.]|jgi:uncharacterized protein (DUF1330 family)|nr:DUF1330 domain-containing protein [Candidatus Acidoferrum sp.]